jgi:hypothetical protein
MSVEITLDYLAEGHMRGNVRIVLPERVSFPGDELEGRPIRYKHYYWGLVYVETDFDHTAIYIPVLYAPLYVNVVESLLGVRLADLATQYFITPIIGPETKKITQVEYDNIKRALLSAHS